MRRLMTRQLWEKSSSSFGRQQFETSETELLKHMDQLAREFRNQAVYKQEFLDIKQTPAPDVELKSKDFKIVTNK